MSYGFRLFLDTIFIGPMKFVGSFGIGCVSAVAVIHLIDAILGDETLGVMCGTILGFQMLVAALWLLGHVPMLSGRYVPKTLDEEERKHRKFQVGLARYGVGVSVILMAIQSTTLFVPFSAVRLTIMLATALLWFPIAAFLFRNEPRGIEWQPNHLANRD